MLLLLLLLFVVTFSKCSEIPQIPAPVTVDLQDNDAHLDGRIFNGREARPGQFPWTALLIMDGNILCAGALISDLWVLTAAHCVRNVNEISVRLGSNLMSGADSSRVVLETTTKIVHEKYNPETTGLLNYDIALIKLPKKVAFNSKIRPIQLASSTLGGGVGVVAMGWGGTSQGGPVSNTLKYANYRTLSNEECAKTWTIFEGQICAKSRDNAPVESACGGDSGGPLVKGAFGATPVHEGVTSFGSNCESRVPTGFSRTSFYRSWIREKSGV